jgi:hypothetical protein
MDGFDAWMGAAIGAAHAIGEAPPETGRKGWVRLVNPVLQAAKLNAGLRSDDSVNMGRLSIAQSKIIWQRGQGDV